MISVLFVCTGNICRSPTAEAIFRKMVNEAKLSDVITSDSAGTTADHVGEAPDVRAQLACRKRGLDIKNHRAREITPEDFEKFDLILVMDWENLTELQQRAPAQYRHKVHLLMRYANDYDAAVVPDPYYGLNEGFNQVLDYCTDACSGLLETLERKARTMQKTMRADAAARAASLASKE
ncbi:MAG: protein-tyrosine-phosphatase [Burkholderia sp.]